MEYRYILASYFPSGLLPPRETPGGRKEKDAVVTVGNGEKEERTIMKKL